MRRIASVCLVLAAALANDAARADHAPTFVVPGRPGVPVIINGYDASYAVVEGDWGLNRPGHVPPTVITGPLIAPAPTWHGYYPATGRQPGYGRREIEPPPNRRLPPPAPSYYREWSTESQALPPTVIPANPPPVIEAQPIIPELGAQLPERGRHKRRRSR
jgi:hypothetical protein